jgi:hypothetical protein
LIRQAASGVEASIAYKSLLTCLVEHIVANVQFRVHRDANGWLEARSKTQKRIRTAKTCVTHSIYHELGVF